MKPVVGIIVGSTRPDRKSIEIAEWFQKKAESFDLFEADYFIIDLKDYPLPFFGEEDTHKAIEPFEQVIQYCDAFVLITPEYNHSITGVLKNALDFAYTEWGNKPAGIVSYGFGANGARAAEHLRGICGALGMVDVKTHILLSLFEDMQNKQMAFRDIHDATIKALLLDLKYWLDLKG
jgi:NAD(P)H-dependent FMN reductase